MAKGPWWRTREIYTCSSASWWSWPSFGKWMPGVKSGSGPETKLFIAVTVPTWLQCWAIPRAVRAPPFITLSSVFSRPSLRTAGLGIWHPSTTPTVRRGSAVIFTSLNVDHAHSIFPSVSRAVHQLPGYLSDFTVWSESADRSAPTRPGLYFAPLPISLGI